MKTNTLHLPEYLTTALSKLSKDFEVNIAFKNTYLLVVVKCQINGVQYTASTRCKLRDRMSKILAKVEACYSEIQDIYDLDCEVASRNVEPKKQRRKEPEQSAIVVEETQEPKVDQTEPKKVLGFTLQDLSEMVRVDRAQRGLSMEKYAVYADVPYATYYRVEKCHRMPSEKTVQKLIDYVFGKAK